MVNELLDRALFNIARRLQNELVIKCPVDTGRLRNSIKVKPQGKGLLISMADYGRMVEFGTPPHIINAKSKEALHWHQEKGKTQHGHPHSSSLKKGASFAKSVKHPGTRPNPFIRNTIQNKLRLIIAQEIMKA